MLSLSLETLGANEQLISTSLHRSVITTALPISRGNISMAGGVLGKQV